MPRYTAIAIATFFSFQPLLAAAETVEQVLVTATQVAEDGNKLPLGWSKIEEEALNTVAPVHINEIMQRVPGAWISRGNGQESLVSLRSPVLTGPGSCGAFYTAADGISLRAPGFCNVNQLFDANFEQAQSIEVIKGPATALYGSNAMHGVINVLSAAPTERLDHRLAVEVGPDEYYRAKYRYSESSGRHGVAINLNATTDDGYKDESGYDQQKLTLRHDYDGEKWDARTVLDIANLEQETAGFIQGEEAYKHSDLKDSNPNPEAFRDAWSWRLYSRLSFSLDDNNTLVITPYLRDNEMEFLQHFLPWQPVEENAHTSAGIRTALHSDIGELRLTSGIDVEYTDARLEEIQADEFFPNQPAGVHYDYKVDATVAAAYTQLRTAWDSAWELTAGLRLEHTNYDYDNRTADGAPCGPDATDCRFFRPTDSEDDFTDLSYNAGVSYAFNDNHLGYLRLARGFRAPQATELYRLQSGQEFADLDAEEIDNIELGLRGSFGENLVTRYDASIYYMEKDNVIFQDSNRQNISGAETEHYGLELSLGQQISNNLELTVNANAAKHTYASAIELLGSSGDIKGNDIDTAPLVFGSAQLKWDMSELTGKQSMAEVEWVYMDEYYLEPDNDHEYEGHSLLNLRVSAEFNKRWSGALRITNLLDEDYAERADYGFGSYRYFTGQPLGAYLEVAYRFGTP
jgi:iron complex outermembrane recepter protein